MTKQTFPADFEEIRRRARTDIESGAVTAGYPGDKDDIIEMLNGALATELVCALRYKRHYYMATGMAAQQVADEFLEHAGQELEHADQLATRIVQLGGEPDFSPRGLSERSHADYVAGRTLRDMIREDLIAERIAIDSYRAMIKRVRDDDPTTRRMLEDILAVEEEHADDLASLVTETA